MIELDKSALILRVLDLEESLELADKTNELLLDASLSLRAENEQLKQKNEMLLTCVR